MHKLLAKATQVRIRVRPQAETHYDFPAGSEPVLVKQTIPRVGIYSGGFDPIHAGHIAFALQAQKIAGLDKIYFVPERQPMHDAHPEHYVHRTVMLGHALRPYNQFSIFDLPDARLTSRSLGRVFSALPRSEYSLLTTASELLWHEGKLPELYRKLHLVVAVTSHAQMAEVLARLTTNDNTFGTVTFIDIGNERVSAASVRAAIRSGQKIRGLLPSVVGYARKQWLYLPQMRSAKNRAE